MKHRPYLKNLFSAIRFITILPAGRAEAFDPRGMVQCFPIVGMLLGAVTAVFDRIALQFWSEPVASLLNVILLIVLTGAFHLDGLGDTADGLLGHRSKDKVLDIMKDSRIGVMGLVAIFCGLSVKWAGMTGLEENRSLFLVIIPAYARAGMLFGIRFFDYGRPTGGTGHDFFDNQLTFSSFRGLLIPVGVSVFLGLRGLWLIFIFAVITGAILAYYKKRMGCITGDMLGAMCETTESMLFLLVSIGSAP